MHEALLKRVRTALAAAVLDGNEGMTALLDEVGTALRAFSGAPSMEAINAAMPRGLVEGPGDRMAAALRLALKSSAAGVPPAERLTYWHDLINGLLGFAEADLGEQRAAMVAWSLALTYCDAPQPPALIWRAPSAQGGGEPEAERAATPTIKQLRAWITPAAEGAGERVKASGLAAVNVKAGCAGVTALDARRFWPVEVHSSGLPAEGDEAAANGTTAIRERG